jgi:hypothetical protein
MGLQIVSLYSYGWVPYVCQITDGWSARTVADFGVWSVLWFLCVKCVAPVNIHCQLVKVYGVCVIPWKQADVVHGFQQWQDRCWQVVTWAPSMSTKDAWCTETFSCWRCLWARHSLGSAQICPAPNGLQRNVCIGCQRIPQIMTQLTVWDCMCRSCIHLTCYGDQREQFWS